MNIKCKPLAMAGGFSGQYRSDLFFLTDQLKRVPHAPVLRVGRFVFSFAEFRWLPPRRNDKRQVRAGLGLGDCNEPMIRSRLSLVGQAMVDSRLLMRAFVTRRHSETFSPNQERIFGRRRVATIPMISIRMPNPGCQTNTL
jgi:hypothetical protein